MRGRDPLDNAASRLAAAVLTPEDAEAQRRARQGIDPHGRPVLEGRDFIPLLSTPGKKRMRLRVADDGTVYATEET